MRAIPATFDPAVVTAINGRLAGVERDHLVTIAWAIESGSRAWGFPSPDSDYDCRFIYLHRRSGHISPWVPRDVIETPLDALLDVNGWDLRKALLLMLKGNAVILEWLESPIVYRGDVAFRDAMLSLARSHVPAGAIQRHYLHLALHQIDRHLGDRDAAAIKKLLYALRPALSLRWQRLHPAQRVPPMHFPTLLAQTDLTTEQRASIEQLLADKAQTREMGIARVPPVIGTLIDSEIDIARSSPDRSEPIPANALAVADVNMFYRYWVDRFD